MGRAEDDVDSLVPLAISAIASLFDIPDDELPETIVAVLHNYGVACHKLGSKAVYEAPTIPHSDPRAHRRPITVPSFPPPPPTGFDRGIDSDAPTLPPPPHIQESLKNGDDDP